MSPWTKSNPIDLSTLPGLDDRSSATASDPGRRGIGAWLLSWPGLAVLGVANGATRELVYSDAVGEQLANQISTGTLAVMIVAFTWYAQRRWPLASTGEAVTVGVLWVMLTIAFEFVFGHYVDAQSWSELLTAYEIWNGELWPLLLVVIGAAPAVVRRVSRRRPAR